MLLLHEVPASEIAYDYWTSVRSFEAIDHRAAFGFSWDPSHTMWQNIDPVSVVVDFKDLIHQVDCKDIRLRPHNGRAGAVGFHLPWGTFGAAGISSPSVMGYVPWEDCFRALDRVGYGGTISVEWADAEMDRLHVAKEALGYVRSLFWELPASSFDSTLSTQH